MLKAINILKIYQNLFKYWFTLLHFALDDPVIPPNMKYIPQGLQTDDKGRQHLMRGADVKAK